ncbi:hypothetical protein B0H11DRAFT_1943779 [Mycena galericulata]|nr:hypothetical protein B0H11DRAFT_1943779 [Mycena galericulata]
MIFLMLFLLKEGSNFSEAKEVTGPIRHLCWGIQYTMLIEIHVFCASEDPAFPTQSEAYNFVCQFVIEKQATMFNSLRSLTHYATALAYQSISLPRIWWTDCENYSEIYSFINNPKNPFSVLKNKLPNVILENPELYAKFVTLDGNGIEQFNLRRCRSWMASLAKLEGLTMLAIEMMSSTAVHCTELAAMLTKNTASHLCNLQGIGKFLHTFTHLFPTYITHTLFSNKVKWEMTLSMWHYVNIAWQSKLLVTVAVYRTMFTGCPWSRCSGVSEQVLHSCLMVTVDWQKVTGLMPGKIALLKAKGNSGGACYAVFNDALLQHFDLCVPQDISVGALNYAPLPLRECPNHPGIEREGSPKRRSGDAALCSTASTPQVQTQGLVRASTEKET